MKRKKIQLWCCLPRSHFPISMFFIINWMTVFQLLITMHEIFPLKRVKGRYFLYKGLSPRKWGFVFWAHLKWVKWVKKLKKKYPIKFKIKFTYWEVEDQILGWGCLTPQNEKTNPHFWDTKLTFWNENKVQIQLWWSSL